jgi:hypothetical protein
MRRLSLFQRNAQEATHMRKALRCREAGEEPRLRTPLRRVVQKLRGRCPHLKVRPGLLKAQPTPPKEKHWLELPMYEGVSLREVDSLYPEEHDLYKLMVRLQLAGRLLVLAVMVALLWA